MVPDQLLFTHTGSGPPEPEARPRTRRAPVVLQVQPGVAGLDAILCTRYAWAAGLFDDAGLAVRVVLGPVDPAGQPAMSVVDAAAAGDRQVVAAIHQRTAVGLVGFADTGLTAPSDLAGRCVGLPRGTAARALWPAYLERIAGLDAIAVPMVEVPDPVAALRSGQVDVAGLPLLAAPGIAAGTGRDVMVLPYAQVLPEPYGSVLVAPPELARDNPDLVGRFATAFLTGVRFGVDEPAEVARVLYRSYLVDDPGLTTAQLRLMRTYVYGGLHANQPVGHVDQSRLSSQPIR